jgi:hypothetical protein
MNDIRATLTDPAMAAADPAIFAPLTAEENDILDAHLTSGLYKQAAVYSPLSEPWRETAAVLDDLDQASKEQYQASQAEREPEAGQ